MNDLKTFFVTVLLIGGMAACSVAVYQQEHQFYKIKFSDGSEDACRKSASKRSGWTLRCRNKGTILGATNFQDLGEVP